MTSNISMIDADVLVVGSGIAGLWAALRVRELGRNALVVCKARAGKAANTMLAGGGFTFSGETFTHRQHLERTLEAGRGLNDRDLVECFVTHAPDHVARLERAGLRGVRRSTGLIVASSSLLGGPRLSAVLVRAAMEAGVEYLEDVLVTDLIVDDTGCRGAVGLRKGAGKFYAIRSRAVMLATGGAGAIYARHDNAPGSTGDGYALALEAGLEVRDMEFVQFYPFVYAGSGHGHMILLPQLAEAGTLTNRLGEDLKDKYGLHERSVAIVSRDRVSQAFFREEAMGNGIDGAMLLDLRGVDDRDIHLQEDRKALLRKRTRYHLEALKVTPACHHTMGGVEIDVHGRTAVPGLYAAGEVTGGIHGANRMGGNALSEALVFGARAGEAAALDPAGRRPASARFVRAAEASAAATARAVDTGASEPLEIPALKRRLQRVLWEKVGIIRNGESIHEAIGDIDSLISAVDAGRVRTPRGLWRLAELRNAALAARAIAISARARTESRGAHFRSDFPEEDSRWLAHLSVAMVEGRPEVTRKTPVP